MTTRPSVAYVVSHPIQYHVPLFRRLAASTEISFVAVYGCDHGLRPSFDAGFGQVVYLQTVAVSGFERHFVPQWRASTSIDRFFGLASRSLTTIPAGRPIDAVVLHGWRTLMMWQIAAACRLRRVPYLLRAETPWFESVRAPRTFRRRVRDAAVKQLIAGASAMLALGRENERFYLAMGGAAERIVRVPYAVDNEAVRTEASIGRARCEALRSEMGIRQDDVVLIGVGKLIPRKRVRDLVELMPGLPAHVHLVWIGSGDEEAALCQRVDELGLRSRVHLAGFLHPRDTWRLLGMADLFVCPSELEPWGLVVNEAVAAGLPVIASDETAAALDLVARGFTGEIVPVGDAASWRRAIQTWVDRLERGERGDRDQMQRLVDGCSLEVAAEGIELAVRRVTSARVDGRAAER